MNRCAIITGIYGQDGSLLADYLLAKNYRVVGVVSRRKPRFRGLESAEIIEANISDPQAMKAVFLSARPDECYHLAAAHHSSEQVAAADIRMEMLRVNFLSTQAILDALLEITPECRFFFAGSSQMHTPSSDVSVVDENTPYRPSSYYGITKVASAQLIDLLRRERGLWGLTAILFNHESTRRGTQFLSRKVSRAAAEISSRKNEPNLAPIEKLHIRDLEARTDWSAATDFVRAFHLSLQADAARDYVLASGTIHSVRDLLDEAFQAVKLDWREHVLTQSGGSTPRACLQGNPQRAQRELGWEPQMSFAGLIKEMVEHDLYNVNASV
jgi:GDPmannose 4,6-dehydratase